MWWRRRDDASRVGKDVVTEAGTTVETQGATQATPGQAYPPPETWPTGRLLSAAARRVERAWDAYLQQWDLTHASVPVLVVLSRGSLSQREIAAKMHVTEQSIGRVLRGLQANGHITRAPHPGDRRRHVVELTPAGLEALHALDHAQSVESLIGTSLSPQETAELRVLLIKMIADLPLQEEREEV
ncbi:winged helix-turn-helix transcriptional regulator [Georgenia wutianyii]|uniref:Winged helix-turn-helix transcriptional regulator n=1 Tax=Georgenia wutianyii TaxID=2585135 RepID=A0ABX5VJH8_9MICO|nr:winged helix-turn-helix transcriptional regulator [Georgenia wutianyii]